MAQDEISRLTARRPARGWSDSAEGQAILVDVIAQGRGRPQTRPRLGWVRSVAFAGGLAAAVLLAVMVGTLQRPDLSPTIASAGDQSFFARFAVSGGSEVEHFDSIGAMAKSADAIVKGKVVDVVITDVITGEENDRVPMVGLVIQPEVIGGKVPSQFAERLTVEFVAASDATKETLPQLRSELPDTTAVWFLRSKAEEANRIRNKSEQQGRTLPPDVEASFEREKDYYRLVSSQGFFVETSAGLANPMADPANENVDEVAIQAEKIKTIDELVALVSASKP